MGIFYKMPKMQLKINKQTLDLEAAAAAGNLKIRLHNNTLSYADTYEYYSEIAASELTTANGYIQGGLTVANAAFSLYGTDAIKFDSDDPNGWTITSTGIIFRWWSVVVETGNPATEIVVALYDYGEDVTWTARALARTIEFNPAGWWTEPFRASTAEVPANIAVVYVATSSQSISGFTLTASSGEAQAIAVTAEADEIITFRIAKMAAQGYPATGDILESGITAGEFESGMALTTASMSGSTVYAYTQSVSSKYGANPAWREIPILIPANAMPIFTSNVSLYANPQIKPGTITNAGWRIQYDYSDAENDTVTTKLLIKTTNSFVEGDWDTAINITPPASATVTATDNYYEYEVTGKSNNTTYYCWVRLEDAERTGASAITSAIMAVTTSNTSPPIWGGSGNAISLANTAYTGFDINLLALATDLEGGLVLYEPNYKMLTDGTWTPHTKYHLLLRGPVTETDAVSAVTAVALANALKQRHEGHRISTREHPVMDNTNVITAANALASDTNTITTLANDIKAKRNAHLTQASVHLTNDTSNATTSANATDLATAYTLLNEMKADENSHSSFPYTVSDLSLAYGTWEVKLVAKDPDGGVANSETDVFYVYDLTVASQTDPTSMTAESYHASNAANDGALTTAGTAGTNLRTATWLKVYVGPSTATAATDTSVHMQEYTSGISVATGAAIQKAVTGLLQGGTGGTLFTPGGSFKVWLQLGSPQDGYGTVSSAHTFTATNVAPTVADADVLSLSSTGSAGYIATLQTSPAAFTDTENYALTYALERKLSTGSWSTPADTTTDATGLVIGDFPKTILGLSLVEGATYNIRTKCTDAQGGIAYSEVDSFVVLSPTITNLAITMEATCGFDTAADVTVSAGTLNGIKVQYTLQSDTGWTSATEIEYTAATAMDAFKNGAGLPTLIVHATSALSSGGAYMARACASSTTGGYGAYCTAVNFTVSANALNFNGTSGYMNCNTPVTFFSSGQDGYILDLIMKPTTVGGGTVNVLGVCCGTNGGGESIDNLELLLYNTASSRDHLYNAFRDTNGNSRNSWTTNTQGLFGGAEHRVRVVYNAAAAPDYYLDSNVVVSSLTHMNTGTLTTFDADIDEKMFLGARDNRGGGAQYFYEGKGRHFRIYKNISSPTLLGYWKCTDGSGEPQDSSGNAYHGTLQGATWTTI